MAKLAILVVLAGAVFVPAFPPSAQVATQSLVAFLKAQAPGGVPILEDIAVVKPDPGVPADLAEFSGAWIGQWRGERTNAYMADQVTVFEKISRESFTHVSQGIGRFNGQRDNNFGQTWAVRNEYPVTFEDGALTYTVARNGNRVTYRIKDGRLTARSATPTGSAWVGTYERVACCRQ